MCFFGPLNRPKICELQVFTHVINATRAFCARRNCYGFTAILVLANDLLPPERTQRRRRWSSLARYEVRLSKVNRRWRGTRYDSPKLIVSEVKVTPFWSFIFPETYIYYRSCIYLNRYKRKMCTTIVLWV